MSPLTIPLLIMKSYGFDKGEWSMKCPACGWKEMESKYKEMSSPPSPIMFGQSYKLSVRWELFQCPACKTIHVQK